MMFDHVKDDNTLQDLISSNDLIHVISFVSSTSESLVKQFLDIHKSDSILLINASGSIR